MALITHPLITDACSLLEEVRKNHGVDPFVWLIDRTVSLPIFSYSGYRLARAVAKGITQEVMVWSTIFGCALLGPYMYVMLFGRNLPWWVYAGICLLLGQGMHLLVRKSRKRTESGRL